MKIKTVSFDGFRGLSDREHSLIDTRTNRAAQVVAVTGPMASGKTSFLEGLIAAKESVAPYGSPPAASDCVRYDADSAKVRVEWEPSNVEREQSGLGDTWTESLFGEGPPGPAPDPTLAAILSSYSDDPSTTKVEYFHAERGVPVGSAVDLTKGAGDTLDRMARLAPDNTKYDGLVRFIVEAGLGLDVDARGNPKPKGRVKQAFESLCGTKKLAGLYRVDGQAMPGFFDAEEKVPFGITQLAASELDLLLFATTFVRAGLVANTAGAILLIDTPEKHVGEADAGALVRALAALGAGNQLIVATRAGSVLDAAQRVIRLG